MVKKHPIQLCHPFPNHINYFKRLYVVLYREFEPCFEQIIFILKKVGIK